MSARTLYRIAAGTFVLFAAGHTAGFLGFKPPTAEAAAVRDAMYNVHFQVRNSTLSYGGFYTGFGLFVTAYTLFAAFLAWHLSRTGDRALGWALCAVQAATLVLTVIYFSGAPVVLSGVLVACLAWAAMRGGGAQAYATLR